MYKVQDISVSPIMFSPINIIGETEISCILLLLFIIIYVIICNYVFTVSS